MWILIKKPPPTRPAPPAFSLFWSLPWPLDKAFKGRRRAWKDIKPSDPYGVEDPEDDYTISGHIPNYKFARKIRFLSADIRLFPHEFTIMKADSIKAFVFGYDEVEPSHCLVPEEIADHHALRKLGSSIFYLMQRGISRPKAVAMLLQGLGHQMSPDTLGVPPLGWYRIRPEYGLIFATEKELQIRYKPVESEEEFEQAA